MDNVAEGWASEWGETLTMPACQWPVDLGPPPSLLDLHELKAALRSFPTQLGLGWDQIHPRALLRLEDSKLVALLRVIFLCECGGRWPGLSSDVIVALLPKPSGGRRPIGLFPWLPKVRGKLRRATASLWEEANTRRYLYGGVGSSAETAAWKQGA